jgi:hypothetical protein
MNDGPAHSLIDAEVRRLRQLAYSGLARLVGAQQTKEVVGDDGRSYQLEIEAVWDGAKGGDIRVIVSAHDGGWRAFKPVTGDFIMRPDGSFAGESPGKR